MYVQMARVQSCASTSGAYHMQDAVCHMVQRDSSAIKFCFPGFWRWTDTVLYTVFGVQEAQTDTMLYTVWGSERVKLDIVEIVVILA